MDEKSEKFMEYRTDSKYSDAVKGGKFFWK